MAFDWLSISAIQADEVFCCDLNVQQLIIDRLPIFLGKGNYESLLSWS